MFMYRFVVCVAIVEMPAVRCCNNSKLKRHNLSGEEDIYLIKEPLFCIDERSKYINPPSKQAK